MKKVLGILALIFALALVVTACDLTGGNTKKVTFDAQSGSAVATQNVVYGEKAVEPQNPAKEGYEFKGWSTNKDTFEKFDFSTAITKDITLFAFWDEVSAETAFNTALQKMAEQNYVNMEAYLESNLVGALVFEKGILKSIYEANGELNEGWVNNNGTFIRKQDGICYKESNENLSNIGLNTSLNNFFSQGEFLGVFTGSFNVDNSINSYRYGSTKEIIVISVVTEIDGIATELTVEVTLQNGLIKNMTVKDEGGSTSLSFTYVKNSKYYAPDDFEDYDDGILKVYLITMDVMDNHWKAVYDGAWAAFREAYGSVEFEFIWKAPSVKGASEQLKIINDAVANGADVIILAAADAEESRLTVEAAMAKGVEFIYVDSPSNAAGYVQAIATDNKAAGKSAGEELLEQLAEKKITGGKIGIISPMSNIPAIIAREEGFRSVFEGKEEWEILDTLYCGGDYSAATNAATTFFANGCVAVFGTNEIATIGAGEAYEALSDKTNKFACGFDYSDKIEELIIEDNLLFTVTQNPNEMGYEGMKTAILILQGKKSEITEKNVDSGVKVITAADLKDYDDDIIDDGILKVYLITMDMLDNHWKAVYDGAWAAFKELYHKSEIEFEFIWIATTKRDANEQLEKINVAVANGADVIILAAIDAEGSRPIVEAAIAKGVEFIYVDSPSDAEDYVQSIKTDNYKAGKAAGEELLEQLAEKKITGGKIGIISPMSNIPAIMAREEGFRKAFEGTGFTLLTTVYCDGDSDVAKIQAKAFFEAGCVAVFGTFEGATTGAGKAYEDLYGGQTEIEKFVCGFDYYASSMEELIKDGNILFTVVQNPYEMGYQGMKTAILILQGRESEITEKNVDSEVIIITAADLD